MFFLHALIAALGTFLTLVANFLVTVVLGVLAGVSLFATGVAGAPNPTSLPISLLSLLAFLSWLLITSVKSWRLKPNFWANNLIDFWWSEIYF